MLDVRLQRQAGYGAVEVAYGPFGQSLEVREHPADRFRREQVGAVLDGAGEPRRRVRHEQGEVALRGPRVDLREPLTGRRIDHRRLTGDAQPPELEAPQSQPRQDRKSVV